MTYAGETVLGGGATHLCGEVIRVLQTSSKQKALCSAEREREGGETALPFHRKVPGGQHGA